MNALPMICVAYAFVSLGFCLGYVACAVLSRNATPDAEPVPAAGFREGATRTNVKPTFPKPPPPPSPPAPIHGSQPRATGSRTPPPAAE